MSTGANYYTMQDVKVLIARRLEAIGGWNVYDHEMDHSDIMTDYFDPESWHGLAEKNGCLLVVDLLQEGERRHKRIDSAEKKEKKETSSVQVKIAKLRSMTVARGASEAEERTAQEKIRVLLSKSDQKGTRRVVMSSLDVVPAHLGNPVRCNWHIERDGIVLDKGNGLLKFSKIPDITDSRDLEAWQRFNTLSREAWIEKQTDNYMYLYNKNHREDAAVWAARDYENEAKRYKLLEEFNCWISRVDGICGGMVSTPGAGAYVYETVNKEKKETVLKPVASINGKLQVGQCFQLKVRFTNGHNRGDVYQIVEYDSKFDLYTANRLGKGYKKPLTGTANPGNYWRIWPKDKAQFDAWIADGDIEFVDLVETEITKTVKKTQKKKV